VGARRVEDLVAWQLAYQLQREVLAFTAVGPAAADRKFCDQIRDSARSAARNTAEGFGRFSPREFARFLRIAAGSLLETTHHLRDGRDCGYLIAGEEERIRRLALRALKANIGLQRYLRRCNQPS